MVGSAFGAPQSLLQNLPQTLKTTVLFGAPTPGLFSSFAKHSAEKTKYIDASQPPHQDDELKGR